MKIKSERDYLADELYNKVESELNVLCVREINSLKTSDSSVIEPQTEESVEIIDKVYNSIDFLYVAKRVSQAICNGTFTLEEIKGLNKKVSEQSGFVNIVKIVISQEEVINVNNSIALVGLLKVIGMSYFL